MGLIVHRYWQMQFCSTPCKDAYQHRLAEETKVKIGHLDSVDGGGYRVAAVPPGRFVDALSAGAMAGAQRRDGRCAAV